MQKSILIEANVNKRLCPDNEKSNRISDAEKSYVVIVFSNGNQNKTF